MKSNSEIIKETEDDIKQDPITDINDKLRRSFPIFFIILANLIIAIPLLSENISNFNEFRIHIVRIVSMHRVFNEGIFPALISPDNMSGFGYALNVFYGPITTYIPIAISVLIGSHDILSLKIFTIIASILSSFTMYFFSLKVTKNKYASTVSALVYTLAPYKLTDIFSRNAVGEYTAFVFLPILFNGLYELVYGNKNKNYLIILGAVGLILSHTITTIYSIFFAIAFLLAHPKRTFTKSKIVIIAIDAVIILLMSAFYIMPLLEYRGFTKYAIFDSEVMLTYKEKVYKSTIGLNDLFMNEFKSFDEEKVDPIIVLSLGIAPVLLSVLTLYLFRDVDKRYKKIYILFLIFSLISIWMCTPLFPWKIMPGFMGVIQFPWRMLGFFLLFDSFICGVNSYLLIKDMRKFAYFSGILIISIVILLGTARAFTYHGDFDLSYDNEYEASTKTNILNYRNVNKEYLPLKANQNMKYMIYRPNGIVLLGYDLQPVNSYDADSENNLSGFNIENEVKDNKLNYSCDIKDINDLTNIELPYLYYPGYSVTLDGEKLDTFETANGFYGTQISKGGHLEIKYAGTALEKAGYIISLIGIILFVILIKFYKKREIDYDHMITGGK